MTRVLRLSAVALLMCASCSALASQPHGAAPAATSRSSPTFPRYERALLLETTSEPSANVSVGDVNGDGTLDVVLAKGRHWPLVDRVLLGDGRGGIASGYNLGDIADRTYSARLVDLDGDGDLDVVISNDAPDPKRTYLNDGTGRFRPGSTYGRAEWQTRNASVADLNGDRQPDIIVANRSEGRTANYLCLNRGKGRFDANCQAVAPYPATTITPADFNRDGHTDLAVPHRDRGQSYVYLNAGHAAFPDSARVPFGPPAARIRVAEAADFDADGLLDIVAIDEGQGPAVYFGVKDGTFSPGVGIADGGARPYALAVSDLDGDGSIDIVIGHVKSRPTIHFNDGSGRRYHVELFGDAEGEVYGFAIADLDKDSLPDIAVARSDAPNVVYFADRQSKRR